MLYSLQAPEIELTEGVFFMEKTANRFRVVDLAYMSMGAALIAICAWITIPAAVPFTIPLL